MGYFPVRYDSRVVIYDRRGFIRLATVKQEVSHRSVILPPFTKYGCILWFEKSPPNPTNFTGWLQLNQA